MCFISAGCSQTAPINRITWFCIKYTQQQVLSYYPDKSDLNKDFKLLCQNGAGNEYSSLLQLKENMHRDGKLLFTGVLRYVEAEA